MSDPNITSLGQAFPLEQARVRELLAVYKTLPTGGFAQVVLEVALKRAEDAAISGDLVAILRSYTELKGCQ